MTPLSSIPGATQACVLAPCWPSKFEHLNLSLLSHVCTVTYPLLAVADTAILFTRRKKAVTDKQWCVSRENVST